MFILKIRGVFENENVDCLFDKIKDYTIFVSDNGGTYEAWLSHTTDTSAVFTGEAEHTYEFFSVVYDYVGHMESSPETYDAVTTVKGCFIGAVM